MVSSPPSDPTITLAELLGDIRKIEVEWLGHAFWVRYKPSAFNENMFDATSDVALSGGGWGAASFRVALQHLLVEWSIKDGNGQMVPIDDETMKPMSISMMAAIYDACQEDQRPKAKSESSSNGTSKQTATKAG